VEDVYIKRDLGYIYHIHRTISNAGKAFIEMLESARDIDRPKSVG